MEGYCVYPYEFNARTKPFEPIQSEGRVEYYDTLGEMWLLKLEDEHAHSQENLWTVYSCTPEYQGFVFKAYIYLPIMDKLLPFQEFHAKVLEEIREFQKDQD